MSGFLRSLYSSLQILYSAESSGLKSAASASRSFEDEIKLSEALFGQLQVQFELLTSGDDGNKESSAASDGVVSQDGFLLLLRCCIAMLGLLEFDQSLIHQRCRTLISILRNVCRFSVLFHGNRIAGCSEEPFIRECLDVQMGSRRSAMASFSCSILEVFMDEFILNPLSRKHVAISDFVSDINEKLLACYDNPFDCSIILELLSCHFLLTDYSEITLSSFFRLLTLESETTFGFPKLGLSVALSLFSISAISSAPYMLQTHLVLSALRCIHPETPPYVANSDGVSFDVYISGFELSINLYARYMKGINFSNQSVEDDFWFNLREASSFKFKIQPVTCEEVNIEVGKLSLFIGNIFSCLSSESEAETVDDYFSFIEGNQHMVHGPGKEEANLFLKFISSLFPLVDSEAGPFHRNDRRINEDIFYLAAILKLMMSCFFKIIPYLGEKNECLDFYTTSEGNTCGEQEFLWEIIRSFGKYGAYPRIMEMFLNATSPDNARQHELKLMLAHFTSLLLHFLGWRVVFLWKSCAFMMFNLMNLLSEENIRGTLKALFAYIKETLIVQSVATKTHQVVNHRSRSTEIASRIQKIRMRHPRDVFKHTCLSNQRLEEKKGHLGTSEDAAAAACNGESFIKCLSSCREIPSEWDDLVDFIECTPGKDYSSWMKNKDDFRKWKAAKASVLRKKRRTNLSSQLKTK